MARKDISSALFDDMTVCLICKRPYPQVHHIFGAYNRGKSDKYRYLAPLCMDHHTGSDGVHNNRALELYLKQIAQMHFEKNIGTREEFINEFGKSYL